jgi:O-antigen/teichoic acid export membrane protein
LGPGEFGVFVGVVALINFFTPFLGLGSDSLMVRNLSREPGSYAVSLGKTAWFYLWSGAVIAVSLFLINLFPWAIPFHETRQKTNTRIPAKL